MKEQPRQFMAFLGVGGLAALANFGSRFLFAQFVGFEFSVLLAFLVGLTSAFTLNRAFVFSDERETSVRTEALRFVVVNLAGLVVTMIASLLTLKLLTTQLGPGPMVDGLAHFCGLGCTAVTSYFAHKMWTFGG